MGTIFRAAISHIHAKEDLKRKTKDYLIASLSITPTVTQSRFKCSARQRALIAACTVVFVCAMSVTAVAYYKTPVSYLSLDINPSVELGVNGFGRVISATAFGSGGTTILNGHNIMDADVKSAVHTLVKSAAQKGYVAQDGSTIILVISETDNTSKAIEMENTAAQGAEMAIKSEGKTAIITKDHIPLEKREEAKKLDITPGKLSLIQKLQALDPSVTVSEYKDVEAKDIMKKIDELKKSANPNEDDITPVDNSNDSKETVSKDMPNSSGTANNQNSQGSTGETNGKNSSVSSAESGKENVSNSSADPQKEVSRTASSKAASSLSSGSSSQTKR